MAHTMRLPVGAAQQVDQRRRTASRLPSPGRIVLYVFVVLASIATVFPFYWMVMGSLMAPVELFSQVPRLWPTEPDTYAYERVFRLVPLGRYFANSVLVSVTTTVLVVFISSLAGYCFARLRFFGKGLIFAIVLAGLMVPYQATIVPLFVMFANFRLINSYPGIILPGLVSVFGVFMMTQFFKSLPPEMREAAIVDGAGDFRVFFSVYLPLARPALATLALLTFLQSWDALLWPMIVAPNPDMRTLQVGLAFIRQQAPLQNQIMAAIVVAAVPVLVAFLLAQRQLIAGIAAGAVKE
jgi:multiple sugar transport system permease protein